jgi:hypothetical protein
MPVEFQTGTYRFGHSLVRPSYRANLQGDPGGDPATGAPAFFGFIFNPAGEGQADPVDLRGGARARRRFIGWQTFFDFGGDQTHNVQPSKLIDTNISTPLFQLPLAAIPSGDAPTALPQRNLLRHLTWSLPSGQRIAASTGSPVLGRSISLSYASTESASRPALRCGITSCARPASSTTACGSARWVAGSSPRRSSDYYSWTSPPTSIPGSGRPCRARRAARSRRPTCSDGHGWIPPAAASS